MGRCWHALLVVWILFVAVVRFGGSSGVLRVDYPIVVALSTMVRTPILAGLVLATALVVSSLSTPIPPLTSKGY
jgi:hypothetical protein